MTRCHRISEKHAPNFLFLSKQLKQKIEHLINVCYIDKRLIHTSGYNITAPLSSILHAFLHILLSINNNKKNCEK